MCANKIVRHTVLFLCLRLSKEAMRHIVFRRDVTFVRAYNSSDLSIWKIVVEIYAFSKGKDQRAVRLCTMDTYLVFDMFLFILTISVYPLHYKPFV